MTPPSSASLCLTCVFARRVQGRRSQTYLLCTNERIPAKYPRQPVAACLEYDARGAASPRRD